jgi:hypothetical protein
VVTTSFANPDMAGTVGTVTVTSVDKYDNGVKSSPSRYEGTVALVTSDSEATSLPASATFTAADAGSYTFTNVVPKAGGIPTIAATDSVTDTIKKITTVDVTARATDQLVFTTPPPGAVPFGQAFTIVVAAEDPFRNVDTSFNGGVTIALPGGPGFTDTV